MTRHSLHLGAALIVALAALAAHHPAPVWAAAHQPPPIGIPPSRGPGPLLPVLEDGTVREPSVNREELTDGPYLLDSGKWTWDVTLVAGSTDRLGAIHSRSIEVMHADLRRGLGHGFEAGVTLESWNSGRVQRGSPPELVQEDGFGPTTLRLGRRLAGSAEDRPALSAGAWVRFPGSPDGPASRVIEGGAFLPVAFPLGENTKLGAMLGWEMVASAVSDGRHSDGTASLALTHEFAARLSSWIEAGSVWSGESRRPWLGVVDGGLTWDPVAHFGLTLGASGGLGGGQSDAGLFGRVGVHS